MRHHWKWSFIVLAGVAIIGLVTSTAIIAENIDPNNDDSQYAWAENVGWINAEPSGNGGSGVQAGDSELSGWMWGENIGWISLSCKNTLSCAAVDYGILNDGNGALSGYGWAENVGWISFSCGNTGSCGTSSYGVSIDETTGEFNGYAWAENVGWISFNCMNTASCGTVDFKVKSEWICDPLPSPPSGSPDVEVEQLGILSWESVSVETGYDIVRGDLGTLRATSGDFSLATVECLDDNRTTTSLLSSGTPTVGDGFWFLVRGVNCGGDGTYDSEGMFQVGLRDAEIAASGNGCP